MKQAFQIITEADARQIEHGATVELAKGGHVTPLAADTLRERRVTVVPAGSIDPAIPDDLAPKADIRRVAIVSDHTGLALRAAIVKHLRGRGLAVDDLGVEGTAPVDYPDTAASVARAVARGEADAGIAIDGAGIGSAIAANKIRGVRAVMAMDETIARYSRQHNGANVLTLGSSLLQPDAALRIIDVWLSTPMTEARYVRRLLKVRRLEEVLNPGDLQRLVEIITEEVMNAQRRAASAPAQCSCHAVLYDCCPDRLRGVLDAGASRIGLHASGGAAGTVAGMINHTLLKPDATRADIEKLCREAAQFHFATVCVNPAWVALSSQLLRGSGVGVCSVVGFPLGATTADVKHYETRRAIFDGATEIDMVINIGALKSGDLKTVERDIVAVVGPCREANVISKVILEVALLNDDEKIAASTLSKAAGADFVKTSTGFASGGATAADVALMRRVVGADMGVKAAGGVRDYEGLKAMVAAGATRVGASAGVKIVQESQGQKTTQAAPAGY